MIPRSSDNCTVTRISQHLTVSFKEEIDSELLATELHYFHNKSASIQEIRAIFYSKAQ